MGPWQFGVRRQESVHDYIGVLVPLERAHLYSYSSRGGKPQSQEASPVLDDDIEARLNSVERRRSQDDDDEDYEMDEQKEEEDNEAQRMLRGRKKSDSEYTVENLRAEMRQGTGGGGPHGRWTTYEIKSKLMNKAVQDIGMGKYNWQLFAVCGFGWFADNLWLQGASLTLPSLTIEFGVEEKSVRYTTSALFFGLSIGSFLWGIGSDMFGRRIPFNATLLIASIFGILSAYMPSWGWVCFMYAMMGFGVGGSLPVDGALFMEFLPDANSSLLTMLSVWWPVGQLISSLIAWFFIAQWPADQGWRYFIITIGVMTFGMFVIRFFIFRLFESPKYLLNRGRQDEAVAVIHGIAYRNGTKTWLTSELLDEVAGEEEEYVPEQFAEKSGNFLKEKLKKVSGDKVKQLFKNRTLGLSTGLIWWAWATIGMGYPLFNAFLPQYFAKFNDTEVSDETSKISDVAYRNYAITSISGVPGSILAAWLVDQNSKFLGRKGTLAMATFFSAIFLFGFVLFGTSSFMQLIFSCIGAFFQNIMYGVLYAYTPEIFPAPVRGAGTGVASFLNRITGLIAPILAANVPGDAAATPIYMSAVLILSAFIGMCYIPIETRGASRL